MTHFDDHAELLQPADENLPSVPPDTSAPARLWHDVQVTTRSEVLFDREGHDPSFVDQAIQEARAVYAQGFKSDCHDREPRIAGDLYAALTGDQVLWDGLRAVALLQPLPDGTFRVLRIPDLQASS